MLYRGTFIHSSTHEKRPMGGFYYRCYTTRVFGLDCAFNTGNFEKTVKYTNIFLPSVFFSVWTKPFNWYQKQPHLDQSLWWLLGCCETICPYSGPGLACCCSGFCLCKSLVQTGSPIHLQLTSSFVSLFVWPPTLSTLNSSCTSLSAIN